LIDDIYWKNYIATSKRVERCRKIYMGKYSKLTKMKIILFHIVYI
jgi:hypothetical protein